MTNFLDRILAEIKPPEKTRPPPVKSRDLRNAILSHQDGIPVIAEVKFRSPSGVLREPGNPGEIAVQMVEGGAIAISVLTEKIFWWRPCRRFRQEAENLCEVGERLGDGTRG